MQTLIRRSGPLSMLVIIAALGPAPAGVEGQSTLPLDIERVSERVLVMAPKTGNSRVVVLNSENGLVMLDSGFSPNLARRLKAEAEAVFGRADWRWVIVSGEEFLGCGGLAAFPEAETVAHRGVREYHESHAAELPDILADRRDEFQWRVDTARARLDTMANPPEGYRHWLELCEHVTADLTTGFTIPLPGVTFDDRLRLDLGDLSLECIWFGGAGSWGDLVVRVPEEHLIWTGDLFHAAHVLPYLDQEDTPLDIDRWIAVLEELLDGDPAATVAFRANGEGTWTWQDVHDRCRLMKDIREVVTEAKGEGISLEDLLERLDDVTIRFPYVSEWRGTELALVRSDILRTVEGIWRRSP